MIKLHSPAEDEAAFSPYSENDSSDGNGELWYKFFQIKQCLVTNFIFAVTMTR
jgi:hypothetical protein